MNTQVTSVSSRTRHQRRWLGLGGLASGLVLAVTALHGVAPVQAQTIGVPAAQVDDRGGLNHDSRLDDVFAQGLDDRQVDLLDHMLHLSNGSARLAGMDDILQQAHGIGVDDSTLADMLLGIDVRQEDRALEVGDDRLAPAADQPAQPAVDVRQEDRALEPGDVRQEDRAPQPGDVRQEDHTSSTSNTSGSSNSGSTSGSGHSSGGSDDASRTSSSSATYYSSAPAQPAVSTASAPATTSAPAKSSSSGSGSSGSGSSGHGSGGHDDAGGHH